MIGNPDFFGTSIYQLYGSTELSLKDETYDEDLSNEIIHELSGKGKVLGLCAQFEPTTELGVDISLYVFLDGNSFDDVHIKADRGIGNAGLHSHIIKCDVYNQYDGMYCLYIDQVLSFVDGFKVTVTTDNVADILVYSKLWYSGVV